MGNPINKWVKVKNPSQSSCDAHDPENKNSVTALALEKINKLKLRLLELEVKMLDLVDFDNLLSKKAVENNIREQFARQYNVEILNVPYTKSEDLFNDILKICIALNKPWVIQYVEYINRHKQRKHEEIAPIIVRFNNICVKRDFIKSARLQGVTCYDLGLSVGTSIYINDHLTRYYRHLVKLAKTKKRKLGYQFLFVRDGRIYMRKEYNSPLINITTEYDLNNLT